MNWLQNEERMIREQDAYRNSRDFQRRYEEHARAKSRAEDPIEPEPDEDEMPEAA
jgi:hypothetical protein